MTEIEPPAPGGYVPGRYEAEALRFMNEWEPSSRVPSKHIVAQKLPGERFVAFEWRSGREVWVPWDGVMANAPRQVMVDALQKETEWANVTIMDEPVDFADYAGIGPAEFDHIVFCERHAMLCPVGAPGGSDGWALVEVDGNGIGAPLGGGQGNPNRSEGGPFLFERELAARFRKEALPVETPVLGYAQTLRVKPVLVRHDRVAREIVPKAGWGISNRPDLAARQIDRELAITAAADAEAERQRKAGEWLQPLDQIRFEAAIRLEKKWAAQAA